VGICSSVFLLQFLLVTLYPSSRDLFNEEQLQLFFSQKKAGITVILGGRSISVSGDRTK
jgi:hypothetical protein